MEVTRNAKDNSLAFRDTFFHISPLSRELDTGLDCFGTSVHGQHHVISKHGGDFLGKTTENTVVERPGRERQFLGLLDQGGHDTGMTVSLNE